MQRPCQRRRVTVIPLDLDCKQWAGQGGHDAVVGVHMGCLARGRGRTCCYLQLRTLSGPSWHRCDQFLVTEPSNKPSCISRCAVNGTELGGVGASVLRARKDARATRGAHRGPPRPLALLRNRKQPPPLPSPRSLASAAPESQASQSKRPCASVCLVSAATEQDRKIRQIQCKNLAAGWVGGPARPPRPPAAAAATATRQPIRSPTLFQQCI